MNAADAAITVLLANDSGLISLGLTTKSGGLGRIYKNMAPQATSADPVVPPYGIFQKMSGSDVYVHGRRERRTLVYMVKFVDKGSSSKRAGMLDERADELLTLRPLSGAGFQVDRVFRTGDIDFTEDSSGVLYQHIGGIYRMEADMWPREIV